MKITVNTGLNEYMIYEAPRMTHFCAHRVSCTSTCVSVHNLISCLYCNNIDKPDRENTNTLLLYEVLLIDRAFGKIS